MSDTVGPIPPEARHLPSGDLLVICREGADLANRAAGYLAVALGAASSDRAVLAALAGGATPLPTYARLAEREVAWTRLSIVLTDERLVSPNDPRSNFRNVKDAFASVAVRVLPMVPPGALEAGHAAPALALDAAGQLGRLTTRRRQGMPVLDLAVCGLGGDGHVASLFPGSAGLEERETSVMAVPAPRPGAGGAEGLARLTLTLPVLAAADRRIFLVSGAGKARALRDALRRLGDSPASRLARLGRATWFVDEAAAALLSSD